MKKKQKFLFPLLMAIVMMAMSPGRAWADCLRVYDNDHDLLGEYTFINDQVFVDLGVGQYIELVLSNNESAECYPTCNALITSDGIVDSDNEETIDGLDFGMYGSSSLLVEHAGRYIVTLSNRSFDEFEVKEDVWVDNWVEEYTGDDADGNPIYTPMNNGYYENRTVGYSVNTANATLTFREVPTFASLDELFEANLEDGTIVTVTVNGTIASTNYDSDREEYTVFLDNDVMIGSANVPSDLGWVAGGTVSGTLTNVKFVKDNVMAPGVVSETTNLFAPGAGLNYSAPAGGSESSDVASVTIGEATTGYADIQTAFGAAMEATEATVTLHANIDLAGGYITFDKGNVTLDLNGKTLTGHVSQVIDVNGGSLTITDNSEEKSGKVDGTQTAVRVESGSITIHAGIFSSSYGSALNISQGVTAYVDGGQYIAKSERATAIVTDGVSLLAPGYAYYITGTETQIKATNLGSAKDVTVKEAGEGPVVEDAVSVTINGTTTGYADFATALTDAKDASSATIKLLQNVDISFTTFDQGNITLDLNGKTIRNPNGSAMSVDGASLTIIDTSEEQTGTVTFRSQYQGSTISVTSGSLTIYAGTFNSTSMAALSVSKAYGSDVVPNVKLYGGHFISTSYAVMINDVDPATILPAGYAFYATGTESVLTIDQYGYVQGTDGYHAQDVTVKAAPAAPDVPTFDSLEELIAANQNFDAVNVAIDDVVAYALPDPDIDNALIVIVRLSDAIVGLISASPEHALNWESGGTVTGTLTNVKWDNSDHILSSETAFWSALNYTEPDLENIPTYNSIADLLDDETLASGTNVTVTVSGTIAMAEYEEDNSYQIRLDNGFTIGAMYWVTSDPGWAVGGTISGTLQNVQFVRGEGEEGEETGAVFSRAKNIFAPGADLEYTAPGEGSDPSDGVVAIVTIEASYQNIQEALAAAKAAPSAALTITEDITLEEDEELIFDAGCITLDLNGYTITGNNVNGVINVTGGSLTITDGTYEKNGKIVNNWNNAIKANAGSLTIYAGTFIGEEGCGLYASSENEGDLTAYISGGRFVTNGWSAVKTYHFSALAPGYAYYNTATGAELEDIDYDNIMDETGETPAKDITVRGIPVVKGDLVAGNNEIYISEITGNAIKDPAFYNIYSFTAPVTATIIVTSIGDEDTCGALFDANFNYLTDDDDEGENGNFYFEYEVTEGSVYYIGVREYDGSEIGDYNIKISVFENLSEMTFVDGTAYDSAGGSVSTLTYQRNVSETQAGKWQALYVPFRFPIAKLNEKGFDVACINNFHEYTDENGDLIATELEIKMLTSGTLKENWPYLIRPAEAGMKEIVLEDVTLAPAKKTSISCSSIEREYVFTGIYQPMTGLFSDGYMFLSGGALRTAANDEQELKAQRWYLASWNKYDNDDFGGDDDESVVEAKSMNIRVIGEDDANGIEEIRVVSTKVAKNSSAGIYDIQGRKVSAPVKGINIIRQEDGSVRKVMVK